MEPTEILLRLGVAAGAGGVIGIERELRNRDAGVLTQFLVGLGSGVYTLVGTLLFGADPSRIAAQVVSGVGFLGMGAIVRDRFSVRGLTTAASVWVTAGLGMASGAGLHWLTAIAAGYALIGLGPVRGLARRALRSRTPLLVVGLKEGAPVSDVLARLDTLSLSVEHLVFDDADRNRVTIRLTTAGGQIAPATLTGAIGDLCDVRELALQGVRPARPRGRKRRRRHAG